MSPLGIFQSTIGIMFVAVGMVKVVRSRQALGSSAGGGWALDFSEAAIKSIGGVEGAAGVGLAVATFAHSTPLSLLSAFALIVIMIGAVSTHIRRSETGPALFAGSLAICLFTLVGAHVVNSR